MDEWSARSGVWGEALFALAMSIRDGSESRVTVESVIMYTPGCFMYMDKQYDTDDDGKERAPGHLPGQ